MIINDLIVLPLCYFSVMLLQLHCQKQKDLLITVCSHCEEYWPFELMSNINWKYYLLSKKIIFLYKLKIITYKKNAFQKWYENDRLLKKKMDDWFVFLQCSLPCFLL